LECDVLFKLEAFELREVFCHREVCLRDFRDLTAYSHERPVVICGDGQQEQEKRHGQSSDFECESPSQTESVISHYSLLLPGHMGCGKRCDSAAATSIRIRVSAVSPLTKGEWAMGAPSLLETSSEGSISSTCSIRSTLNPRTASWRLNIRTYP